MKKAALVGAVLLTLAGCKSVESTVVSSSEIVGNGGDAIAVIQVSVIGITALFHLIDLGEPATLDTAINKTLVASAKEMGASKVDLKSVATVPRQGVFMIFGQLISFPETTVVGVAVK